MSVGISIGKDAIKSAAPTPKPDSLADTLSFIATSAEDTASGVAGVESLAPTASSSGSSSCTTEALGLGTSLKLGSIGSPGISICLSGSPSTFAIIAI